MSQGDLLPSPEKSSSEKSELDLLAVGASSSKRERDGAAGDVDGGVSPGDEPKRDMLGGIGGRTKDPAYGKIDCSRW